MDRKSSFFNVPIPYVFVGFVLLLLTIYLGMRSTVYARPRLAVETTHDIPPVPSYGQKEILVPIRNTGRGPLSILDVKTGCACLKYALSDHTIPPGGTQELKLVYNLNDLPAGVRRERILLETNDPAHRKTVLSINLQIVGAWNAFPKRLHLYAEKTDGPHHGTLTIVNEHNPDETLLSVESQSEFLSASIEGRVDFPVRTISAYRIRVSAETDFDGDRTVGQLVFRTSSEKKPEFAVDVEVHTTEARD